MQVDSKIQLARALLRCSLLHEKIIHNQWPAMNAKTMPESLLQESPLFEPINTAGDADDLEPCPIQQAEACSRLWRAALALLVEDAVRHALGGVNPRQATDYDLEAAFDDICRLGPMLRHLCDKTGDSPEWVRARFMDAVLDARDGTRKVVRAPVRKGGRQRAVSK